MSVQSGFLRSQNIDRPVKVTVKVPEGQKTGLDRTFKHYPWAPAAAGVIAAAIVVGRGGDTVVARRGRGGGDVVLTPS
jgi:hypothetical protein